MAVALPGFVFDGNIVNWGVGVKLRIYRGQGARTGKKTVKKVVVTEMVKSSMMVKSCVRKAMRAWWLALWQEQMLEYWMHQSSPWNICPRNTYCLYRRAGGSWRIFQRLFDYLTRQQHRPYAYTQFSTTKWRSTAQKWAGIGNYKLCICRTWTISTSLFYLQHRNNTVL